MAKISKKNEDEDEIENEGRKRPGENFSVPG